MSKQGIVREETVAIAVALGVASTRTDPSEAVASFQEALTRRGYMVVRQDHGKEGLQPDYFYKLMDNVDPACFSDRQDLLEEIDLELGEVAQVGRAMKLPPIFIVKIPIADGEGCIDGYEFDEFDTIEKAETMAKAIVTPEDEQP